MGRDKAWLLLDGRPIIEHIIGELRQVTREITIIANDPDYSRLGLPFVGDVNLGIGPLEAIRTALANSGAGWTILIGCDLPFVTAELLQFMLDRAEGYQAVVPRGPDDRLQPLCAAYSSEALDPVSRLITSGERKVSPLFDQLQTRVVSFEELRHLGGSERFFVNVNTPDDYARALELARRRESG